MPMSRRVAALSWNTNRQQHAEPREPHKSSAPRWLAKCAAKLEPAPGLSFLAPAAPKSGDSALI